MNIRQLDKGAFLIGRLVAGGVYLWAGIDNIMDLDGKAGYAASKGLASPKVFVTIATLLLLVAAFSILAGFQPHIGVAALALFLIPVTVIMHNFWALKGFEAMAETHNFQGNIIMIGSALVFLLVPRPWPFSLDQWVASRSSVAASVIEAETA